MSAVVSSWRMSQVSSAPLRTSNAINALVRTKRCCVGPLRTSHLQSHKARDASSGGHLKSFEVWTRNREHVAKSIALPEPVKAVLRVRCNRPDGDAGDQLRHNSDCSAEHLDAGSYLQAKRKTLSIRVYSWKTPCSPGDWYARRQGTDPRQTPQSSTPNSMQSDSLSRLVLPPVRERDGFATLALPIGVEHLQRESVPVPEGRHGAHRHSPAGRRVNVGARTGDRLAVR